MKLPWILASAFFACLSLPAASPAMATHAGPSLSFGVLKTRSAVATAQYWNPILRHVSQKSGVPLKLRLARSGAEHATMIIRGELDFIYSNYQFASENEGVGYRVIARPLGAAMRSQIIVPADSSLHSLDTLRGQDVAFVSPGAFAGYMLPMDALLHARIPVKQRFGGTPEGAMGQMLSGRAQAAAVNADIAREYAGRKKIAYRVLWSSQEYPAIPVAAHPAVPADTVAAVRDALLKMVDDPQGRKILAASAPLFGEQAIDGFAAASESEYDSLRRFHKIRLAPRGTP